MHCNTAVINQSNIMSTRVVDTRGQSTISGTLPMQRGLGVPNGIASMNSGITYEGMVMPPPYSESLPDYPPPKYEASPTH